MSDNSAIEWTDTTWIVDRGGRRIRRYQRCGDVTRPGQQERRRRLTLGERWCRGCRQWLSADDVSMQGQCRPCTNAEYRQRYAVDGRAIRARVHARKRHIAPMPTVAIETLTLDFNGSCAYCAVTANTWDHIIPVASGGGTVPGNIAPACQPCNSSKGTSEVISWLERTGRSPHPALIDLLALDYLMAVA